MYNINCDKLIKAIASGNIPAMESNGNDFYNLPVIREAHVVELIDGKPTVTKVIQFPKPKYL